MNSMRGGGKGRRKGRKREEAGDVMGGVDYDNAAAYSSSIAQPHSEYIGRIAAVYVCVCAALEGGLDWWGGREGRF